MSARSRRQRHVRARRRIRHCGHLPEGAELPDHTTAEAAVQHAVEGFERLDILVNNAGLMLLGPVVGADAEEWGRMIAINVQGLLYTTPRRATAPAPGRRAKPAPG